ncbi:MAG: hypothetical protein M3Q12_09850 [Pseudomonadota bacterium]|uniref:hypothetical protein n=1 Tax=Polaromonas sp. TaxID=1869339 RepID=UPI00183B8A67|nr:hypothetical protein [Polaromonas sp.]MBA3594192.1 hypothetical protein [Polaromonas sp.]MDQ3272452.1 hypothetical protein [Pseudomonadota bacterium]
MSEGVLVVDLEGRFLLFNARLQQQVLDKLLGNAWKLRSRRPGWWLPAVLQGT